MRKKHGIFYQKNQRNPIWLFVGTICLSIIGWYVNTIPPLTIWLIILFLLFVAYTILAFAMYITNNVRRSIFMVCGVVGFLTLRLINLYNPFYALLLIIILILIDRLLTSPKQLHHP